MGYLLRKPKGGSTWTQLASGVTSPQQDNPGAGVYLYAWVPDRYAGTASFEAPEEPTALGTPTQILPAENVGEYPSWYSRGVDPAFDAITITSPDTLSDPQGALQPYVGYYCDLYTTVEDAAPWYPGSTGVYPTVMISDHDGTTATLGYDAFPVELVGSTFYYFYGWQESYEIRFTSVEGALSYDVEVAEDEAFSTIVYSTNEPTPSFYPDEGIWNSYWWRVRARNGDTVGPWSPARWSQFGGPANPTQDPVSICQYGLDEYGPMVEVRDADGYEVDYTDVELADAGGAVLANFFRYGAVWAPDENPHNYPDMAGTYQVRTRNLHAEGQHSPWSPWLSFVADWQEGLIGPQPNFPPPCPGSRVVESVTGQDEPYMEYIEPGDGGTYGLVEGNGYAHNWFALGSTWTLDGTARSQLYNDHATLYGDARAALLLETGISNYLVRWPDGFEWYKTGVRVFRAASKDDWIGIRYLDWSSAGDLNPTIEVSVCNGGTRTVLKSESITIPSSSVAQRVMQYVYLEGDELFLSTSGADPENNKIFSCTGLNAAQTNPGTKVGLAILDWLDTASFTGVRLLSRLSTAP